LTPPSLERLVKTCLAKDPDERWQNAHDLVAELRWIAESGSPAGAAPGSAAAAPRRWWLWAIAAVCVVAASGIGLLIGHASPVAPERMDFSIALSERTILSDFLALSPDGKTLAFAAVMGGKSLVCVRNLASEEVRALPGTDSPESVFWSPDGRSLGF